MTKYINLNINKHKNSKLKTKKIKIKKLNTKKFKNTKNVKKRTIKNLKKSKIYTKNDYNDKNGMLTSVWGPSLWHYLHVVSFNYPNKPTLAQKKYYKAMLLNLQYTLPCKYCRINLKNNFKKYPLNDNIFNCRRNFSRYIYNLHELINKMLGKNSGLSYNDIRERYEHFRSRCTIDDPKIFKYSTSSKKTITKKISEKGCTTPLYGKKSKCVISIVPQEKKCKTFKIDKKCLKHR